MWFQTGTEATNGNYDDSVVMNFKRQVVHLSVACPMSDWVQATGQLPYLQHFNPIYPPFHLYTPASLYQSFSLRVLDVVMDHQKKYPCQTTKKKWRKKDNIGNASSLAGSKNIPATCESSVTTLADFDLFILFVLRDFVCIFQPLLTVLLLLTATLPVFCTINDPLSKHKEQFGWIFTQESITTYVLAVSSLQDSYPVNLPISFGSTDCYEIWRRSFNCRGYIASKAEKKFPMNR